MLGYPAIGCTLSSSVYVYRGADIRIRGPIGNAALFCASWASGTDELTVPRSSISFDGLVLVDWPFQAVIRITHRGEVNVACSGPQLLDFARRVRHRRGPKPRDRLSGMRVAGSTNGSSPHAAFRGCKATRREHRHRRCLRARLGPGHRGGDHGAEQVRAPARTVGRRRLERVVGRRPAIPYSGVHPDPPPQAYRSRWRAERRSISSTQAPPRPWKPLRKRQAAWMSELAEGRRQFADSWQPIWSTTCTSRSCPSFSGAGSACGTISRNSSSALILRQSSLAQRRHPSHVHRR